MTGVLQRPSEIPDGAAEPLIRPVRAGDAGPVREFLCGLSPGTAYRRFFAGIGHPSAAWTERLIRVEPGRRAVLIATAGATVVGLADCARPLDAPELVEAGVVVADGWQRRGLGPRLVGALLTGETAAGAQALRLHTLAANAVAVRLIRLRWPDARARREDGTLVWHLPLPQRPPSLR